MFFLRTSKYGTYIDRRQLYLALLQSSHATQKISHLDTLACLPYTYVAFNNLSANCVSRPKPGAKKGVFLAFLQQLSSIYAKR